MGAEVEYSEGQIQALDRRAQREALDRRAREQQRTEPPMCIIDLDGFVWPTVGSTGAPIGRVASAPHEIGSIAESEVGALIVDWLGKIQPAELERAAMARLGMGDGDAGPTRAMLDVLKELARA